MDRTFDYICIRRKFLQKDKFGEKYTVDGCMIISDKPVSRIENSPKIILKNRPLPKRI